jgi:hypothetical protein
VLKILEEAQKWIFLAKTLLDKPQPMPTCVCRKAVDHYSNAVVLQCCCCEDKFHHCCIGLKKKVAQNTKDDWICGWCSGADIDITDNRDDEGDDGDVRRGIDALQEHTWTMVRIARKKKGEPKPQQGEEVTYMCLWGETVFSYRISKRKRVVELLGTSVGISLKLPFKTTTEECSGCCSEEWGSPRVRCARNGWYRESVVVTAELLDNLQDAGLLDPKAIIDNGDK